MRHALRVLLKSPGFTATVVLMLALGIGANTAVFSIVDGVLLRPLPYKNPDRLVDVLDASVREKNMSKLFASYADCEQYSRHARSFEQVAALTWAVPDQVFTGHGRTRQLHAIPVTQSFFPTVGIEPEIGRTFVAGDLNRGCSVVLSDGFWRSEFGGDPAIAGRNLTLDNRPCTVLGVMPARFSFYPPGMLLWRLITPDFQPDLGRLPVVVIGRLRPGVTAAQAQGELAGLHSALHTSDLPERDFRPQVDNLQDEFTWLAGRNLKTTLWLLLAAVGLVLLIACLNVATLLLGRSVIREKELAIRAALGAGQVRLLRQLLLEGLLLSITGGALGLGVAFGALRAFTAVSPVELPPGAVVSMNTSVLAFTAALALLTALVFGLVPAWKASRTDVNESLKTAGRGAVPGGFGLSRVLAGAEMALSVILLAGAGLVMASVLNMHSAALGFDPNRLLATSLTLPRDRYPDPFHRLQFYGELQRRLEALPGIEGVALATNVFPAGGPSQQLYIKGRPIEASKVHDVVTRTTSPQYFAVARVALRRGRVFDQRDRGESQPVAVINEALAREYFPNANPIGQLICLGEKPEGPWLTVVGVVDTEKRSTVYQEMNWIDPPAIYRPLAQESTGGLSILVRISGGEAGTAAEIQQAIAALDANIPDNAVESMSQRLGRALTLPRFRAILLGAFAALALLLAAVGLYGVLAQFVAQRRREIGVRMAIGAQITDVLRLIAIQGGVPVICGLAAGLFCTVAFARYFSSLLYGTRPADPFTLAAVALALVAAAAAAIFIPARRAARVDPVIALRDE